MSQGYKTNFDFSPNGKSKKKNNGDDEGLPPIVQFSLPKRQEEIINSIIEQVSGERYVKACFLLGSLARETGDKLSDIDLTIIVADNKGDKWFSALKPLIEGINPILFAIRTDVSKRSGVFIFPDLIELDVAVIEESEFQPSPVYTEIKPMFDPDGIADRIKERSSKLPKKARIEALLSTESLFFWGVLAVRKRLLRDNVWDARDALEKLRYLIVRLIDLGDGTLNGYRGIERRQDSETLLRLSKTAPCYDKDAVLSALAAITDLFIKIRKNVFDQFDLEPNTSATDQILEILRSFR
jgi:predicted nucleotidyltransferase